MHDTLLAGEYWRRSEQARAAASSAELDSAREMYLEAAKYWEALASLVASVL